MISAKTTADESLLNFEIVSDVLIVSFPDGDMLEPVNAEKTCRALSNLIDQYYVPKIILIDFVNVRYMSTTALNLLLPLEKRLKAQGSNLRFFNLSHCIQELFIVTGLHNLFTILQKTE